MAFLKKVNVPDNDVLSAYAAAAYDVGVWAKEDGEFSASDIAALPSGQKNKPGYAFAGAKKLTRLTTSDDNVTGRVGVIGKNITIPEDSDTSHDSVAAGQSCLYFRGGQFETDQYVSVSGTGAAFGDYLKVDANGKLVEEASPTTETTKSVARVVKINNSGTVANDSLVFEIIR